MLFINITLKNITTKKQGHRQPYTKLVINTINKTAKKAAEETAEA